MSVGGLQANAGVVSVGGIQSSSLMGAGGPSGGSVNGTGIVGIGAAKVGGPTTLSTANMAGSSGTGDQFNKPTALNFNIQGTTGKDIYWEAFISGCVATVQKGGSGRVGGDGQGGVGVYGSNPNLNSKNPHIDIASK